MGITRTEIVVSIFVILLIIALVLPAIQQARESAWRSQSKNNLWQIGMALQNYYETYRILPAGGIFDEENRGRLGWMISIVPFMDSSPLYNQLDLNQPWDSTRNAGLLLERKLTYEIPGQFTQVDDWQFPLAHYSANSHVIAANHWTALDEIESSSQVFLVAELAGDFTPWASPYNFRPVTSLNGKPPIYGRYSGVGAMFLFADGHVEFVTNHEEQSRRDSLAGPDLSDSRSRAALYPRPAAFPVPEETLRPRYVEFSGEVAWALGMENRSGQLIELMTVSSDHRMMAANSYNIQQMTKYVDLQRLVLSGEFNSADLSPLQGLLQLEELSLSSNRLSSEGLDVLKTLPKLRKLTVYGPWATDSEVEKLKNLLPQCEVSIR